MGFYGNITNTSKQNFVFDQIYPNRKTMDDNVSTDGIFIGRFVLVDYNEGQISSRYTRLYKNGSYYYFSTDYSSSNRAEYLNEPFYLEDGTINPLRYNEAYGHYIFQDEIFYTLNDNTGVQTFYQCTGPLYTGSKYFDAKTVNAPVDSDIYFNNYSEDRAQYPDMSRGYDSTVWQKTYVDSEEKYVMIAELNSVVPTFDLTIDAPSVNPIKPHFDADSTNVYYRLHVQPAAGIRIADVSEKDGKYEGNLSDEKVSSREYNWNPERKQMEWIGKDNYNGAIYYNKDGFNSDVRVQKDDSNDSISFGLTGQSGAYYNSKYNHSSGEVTPRNKENDIYELSINLPSVGNAISNLWDLVYGPGELMDGEENKYRRNKNIDWNNTTGLRLIRQNIDESGFTYSPEQVETIAGCINSVHDLMGMIITEETIKQDETEEQFKERIQIENALTNRIYYGNYEPDRADGNYKGYYIKYLTYDYDESQHEKQIEEVVGLKDFSQGDYYYIDNNNYYKEVDTYKSGNKYYTLENRIHPKALYEKDWESSKYYYKDINGDFVLDSSKWPDENKQYYIITPGFETAIDAAEGQWFFPTDQTYFEKYFKSEISDTPDKDGYIRGNGLFYWDANSSIYVPFTVGVPYHSELYWFNNFVIERSTDVNGQPVDTYDFDKGAVKTIYTMTKFEQNKYYYENTETGQYELLKSEAEIDRNKIYKTFASDSIDSIGDVDFYEPDLYYYKEGNDYLLATENRRMKELDNYFIIDGANEVNDIFYEPNVYYYQYEDDYILDENNGMTKGRKYYSINFLYVIEDPTGVYKTGTKLNEYIDLTVIPGLKYGTRKEKYEWKELIGFGRTLNTINGLILDLNNLICFDDKLTRDTNTIQGCINQMNDIINIIDKLKPGYITGIDEYGRISSMKPKTDNWINVTVNENNSNEIVITHEYHPVDNTVSDSNLNGNNDTIELYTPKIDEKGHVIGSNTETITLPYSYKTIKVKNSEGVAEAAQAIAADGQSADNTQDVINFNASNRWIKIDNNTDDTIQFGHKLSPATPNTQFGLAADVSIENLDTDNTFEVPNFTLDEAGHVIDAQTHTIKIPESFAEIIVQGTSNQDTDSTAVSGVLKPDSLTDALTIASGNKWIELKADETNDKFEILHYTKTFNKTSNPDVNYNTSGNTIELQQLNYDNAGHITGETNTKYTLPNNYQTLKILNDGANSENLLTAVGGDLKASSVIDTATINTGNRWIQLIANGDAKSVNLAHAAPGGAVTSIGDTNDLELTYGNSFNMPYFTFDKTGHIFSANIRKITMPITPAKNQLIDYTSINSENTLLSTTDTINSALAKLENQIILNQNDISDNKGTIESNTNLINLNKEATDAAIATNANNLAQEIERATAAEDLIKNSIPMIPAQPTTTGYYILHVLEDGTAEWLVFDYNPVDENPSTEEEPIE